MKRGKDSKEHHWWPVGLQSYWADENGDVSCIMPNGLIEKKRFRNRKIGQTLRGHLLLRGSAWKTNFEGEFTIDNKVHDIAGALAQLAPDGILPAEMTQGHLDDNLDRELLLFVMSLMIRIPSSRHRFELYPTMVDLPPNEDVGKANMNHHYRMARRICETGTLSNRHYTFLHSTEGLFIYGDGCLDWLSTGLLANRISGRALLALTPHISLYINTPSAMRSNRDYASIRATPEMVERANLITQIYSKQRLFFLGKAPKITNQFRAAEFLQHASYSDELFDDLDARTGHLDRPGFLQGFW